MSMNIEQSTKIKAKVLKATIADIGLSGFVVIFSFKRA